MSQTDQFIGKIRAVGIEPSDFLLLEINPEHIVNMGHLQNLLNELHKAGFHHVSVVFSSEPMKITSVRKK